jgi:hypothetical protein
MSNGQNILEKWLAAREFSEIRALNLLQGAGMISDNCVTAADVGGDDLKRAIFFLADFVQCRQCGKIRLHCCCG